MYFQIKRSCRNIIRKINENTSSGDIALYKLRSYFLPERVRNYWNNLPNYVKSSVDVPSFKAN